MDDRETELLEENRKLLQVNEKLQQQAVKYDQLKRLVCSLLSNADEDIDNLRNFVNGEL